MRRIGVTAVLAVAACGGATPRVDEAPPGPADAVPPGAASEPRIADERRWLDAACALLGRPEAEVRAELRRDGFLGAPVADGAIMMEVCAQPPTAPDRACAQPHPVLRHVMYVDSLNVGVVTLAAIQFAPDQRDRLAAIATFLDSATPSGEITMMGGTMLLRGTYQMHEVIVNVLTSDEVQLQCY
jgi:hypothetical protein